MDGFDPHQAMIVLAATNRPDVLDQALLRPGRFDRRVVVDRPDRAGRVAILRVHVRDVPLAPDVKLGIVAASTVGMVGADLANLVNEAALTAARRSLDQVTHACFEEAMDRIMMGAERPLVLIERHDDRKRVTAVSHPRLTETVFRPPQLTLFDLGPNEWLLYWKAPAYVPRRKHKPASNVTQLPLFEVPERQKAAGANDISLAPSPRFHFQVISRPVDEQ